MANVELSNEQVIDLFERLGSIETKLEALAKPGAVCAVHTDRLDRMEKDLDLVKQQQGKQNLIAVTLGAIGAALVLAIKYLAGK
jgi:hypothetical protein